MNRIIRRLPHLPHHDNASDPTAVGEPGAEDPIVRQYRFLLRTAPADALEEAHVEALTALDPADRLAVLDAVQTSLVAGLRLSPENCRALAHLVTTGERRLPGALLNSYPEDVLQRLAWLVISSEAAFGLFGGYAGWDGAEPEPAPELRDMAGFDEDWHQELTSRHQPPEIFGGFGSGGA